MLPLLVLPHRFAGLLEDRKKSILPMGLTGDQDSDLGKKFYKKVEDMYVTTNRRVVWVYNRLCV